VRIERVHAGTATLSLCITESVFERMRGLLGRAPLGPGEAMVIDACNMVHTVGMGYAIDIVFVDRAGTILRICPAVRPGRMRLCLGARQVVELAAGEAARQGLAAGQVLPVDTARAAR
jgi:uncharacterized membrane protein (UPF0127 family)